MIEFLRSAEAHLINVGGHPMAAGFTVETEKLFALQEFLENSADILLTEEILTRILKVDCETSTADVLMGAHETMDKCSMLVVEVWNHPKLTPNFADQSTNIMAMTMLNGFTHSRVVDVSTVFGEVWTYDIAFWR